MRQLWRCVIDRCACQITVPLDKVTIPQGGSGVGRKLPHDKRVKLCRLQSLPNLCKDNVNGEIDWEGKCEKIAEQLNFNVSSCREITPDIVNHKENKYNVCALNNVFANITDHSWYYVTSKALTSHAVENSPSYTCKNGLNELVVKKNF
uniref:Uncharacterized protein n=1 Tax=Cacopsylla melanoneura TaxID=428564 RepID=A0A8D9AKA5_9HEMI